MQNPQEKQKDPLIDALSHLAEAQKLTAKMLSALLVRIVALEQRNNPL
jgi:hypothetical protein